MHLLLMPLGSSGDVHPFLGLGGALRARGHEVTLLTNGHFRGAAERAGLAFVEIGTAEMYREWLRDPDLWHHTRGFRAVFKPKLLRFNRKAFEEIRARHRPGETVVVAGTLALGARVAREVLDVRLVTVHLQPTMLFSPDNPPTLPPFHFLAYAPRWLLRGAFWLLNRGLFDPVIRRVVEPLRRDLGLPPGGYYLGRYVHSPDRVLALFPAWYGRVPDWPQIRQTGFPLFDDRTGGELPPDVRDFLAAGPAPVVATFGTGMVQGDRYFAAVADALRLTGRRGLLLTPFREQVPATLPAGVRHVDYLPFGLILPHALALVHHGGVGTTAQGLAAGVPQVVMPLSHDQPDNADRLARLGVGRTLWPQDFTGRKLAKTLDELLADPRTAPACADAAAKLRGTDALAAACDAIESVQRQPG